ncbi:lytic murein transglycosylase [Aestuariivirga litoralis]|uniref:lytic murein transglycosylase n=1 Tax=Aestuariivirga litoralis TaxID=2650924 RepID=UPI0018C57C7C|nr:lytic murein transglycosylase [Aestuariivirga litoralis]MBG1233465.1 lytic murein transglycosylase [Aestuariivirga litoralis]
MKFSAALFGLAIGLASSSAMAASCGNTAQGFDGFLAQVKKEAAAKGISPTAMAVLSAAKYDPGIIKRDRAQNVFATSFLQFAGKMATDGRVTKGRALIAKNKATFDAVQQQFGVPAPVITAFWALETDFGGFMGSSPTVQSLVTLAWDCRRPEKFRPQIIPSLHLIDKGWLSPEEMQGAWAGEIGQTQFMAYDYDTSGVDFDGDGKVNLRDSVPDVIASTANLLKKSGWAAGQPWLQEVKITADLPWDQADLAITHSRAEWAKWGIATRDGQPIKADKMPAALLLPMGKDGPAFLAYPNFLKAYLKWNESLIYSTTAAYLATRIAGAPPVSAGRAPVTPPTYEQVVALQNYLDGHGYDVGKADGKIGAGTRAAVKAEQLKMGWPADSYPTPAFIAKLMGQ